MSRIRAWDFGRTGTVFTHELHRKRPNLAKKQVFLAVAGFAGTAEGLKRRNCIAIVGMPTIKVLL